MVVHVWNPSPERRRQESHEFKIILSYIRSSKKAWATWDSKGKQGKGGERGGGEGEEGEEEEEEEEILTRERNNS